MSLCTCGTRKGSHLGPHLLRSDIYEEATLPGSDLLETRKNTRDRKDLLGGRNPQAENSTVGEHLITPPASCSRSLQQLSQTQRCSLYPFTLKHFHAMDFPPEDPRLQGQPPHPQPGPYPAFRAPYPQFIQLTCLSHGHASQSPLPILSAH